MRRGYPNLELIEYICRENAFKYHKEALKDAIFPTFEIDTFIQTWSNTATGFDANGGLSGQAITKEYTTVCEMSWCNKDKERRWIESKNKIYGVFFGNCLAYMIINPNKQFFNDLKNRLMRSQRYYGEYIGGEDSNDC